MYNPVETIIKKREGKELSREEIQSFIQGVTDGSVADYQSSAFLMATYFKGMTLKETVNLTEAMTRSGKHYDLSGIPGHKSDKHSTGGVGDKVSIILAPLAAACGLKVPMMSGRGLGHTGGTLDKLESIKGFNVKLTEAQFETVLKKVGCAMIGQTEAMVPADRKLYALRDVTGTVECIPLITASILSKKIAEGTQSLVLDVKVGSGAFMKTKEQARKLSKWLLQVAAKSGLKCRVLLTNMDQPLGYAAGNSLEIVESIEILKGERILATNGMSSNDLRELTLQLCAQMLEMGKVVKSVVEGRKLAIQKLEDGSAYKKFLELVEIQSGSVSQIEKPLTLPIAETTLTFKARKKGYISKMDTQAIGNLLVLLGAGRLKAADSVDPSVGFLFHARIGSQVKVGDPLVKVYYSSKTSPETLREIEEKFHKAIEIKSARQSQPKLIIETLTQ